MEPGRRLARLVQALTSLELSAFQLAPGHAGAHAQDIADRDALISRAAQPRQVAVTAIVQAADRAIVERGADERRGDRLRGRVARLTALRAAAHAVALQRDLAALQDQEPERAAVGHVVAEAEADVAHLEGQVRERAGVRRERPHRIAAPDDAHRPDLVLVADRRRLVLGCRVHGVLLSRRRLIARGRRHLTKQVMLVRIGLVAQARSRLDNSKSHRQPSRRSILGRHPRGSRLYVSYQESGRSVLASPELCDAQPKPAMPPMRTKPA
jgi:hypothetical protein